jgi:hypothetical protein
MSDPRSRVAAVLTLMRQLEGVMQAENALLREMRLARLQELQAEKAALADRYELELRRLRGDPAGLAALETDDRVLLESAMRGFQVAARRNAERLARARTVAEGIARVLGESVAGAPAANGYGTAPRRGADVGGRVIAVAFDRRC